MNIFPAVDIYGGKAVRLLHGDYEKMTVYGDDPLYFARDFESCGAKYIHLVDLEGAKIGECPNFKIIEKIAHETSLFVEVGGGIRSMEVAERYLESGVERIIIGTAAVSDRGFFLRLTEKYGDRVAVGVDIKDGFVAVKGWVEKSELDAFDFCRDMVSVGVKNIICTDISRDGAMMGTNRDLYKKLSETVSVDITASGGVSSIDDVRALKNLGLYGAIIGKAYYTGDIKLTEALEAVK